MRLNKYISHLNVASRREADKLIQEGKVKVNGEIIVNPATQVTEDDKVEYDFDDHRQKRISVKLNKPRGYVVSTNSNEGKTIYELIKDVKNVYPVGRLDKDSSGIIILTNDGILSKKIISPERECEKEYYVNVDCSITDGALKKLEYGMSLDGYKLKKTKVKRIDGHSFYITLTEGRNRQIRRMCNKIGCEVMTLKRIRIAGIKLGDLKEGNYKVLTEKEIDSLKND